MPLRTLTSAISVIILTTADLSLVNLLIGRNPRSYSLEVDRMTTGNLKGLLKRGNFVIAIYVLGAALLLVFDPLWDVFGRFRAQLAG